MIAHKAPNATPVRQPPWNPRKIRSFLVKWVLSFGSIHRLSFMDWILNHRRILASGGALILPRTLDGRSRVFALGPFSGLETSCGGDRKG